MNAAESTYTIKQLADLAGVSVRTLHYYDRIGVLHPRRSANNYRVYGPAEVDRLQLILLYRAADMSLSDVARCLDDPAADTVSHLQGQRARLAMRRAELDKIIATVDATIAATKGTTAMTDQQKFEGLKANIVAANEQTYGAEARAKYGDEAVDASHARLMDMTPAIYEANQQLEQQIKDELRAAMGTEDPASPAAQHVCALHAQWLQAFWKPGTYTLQAHAGLAQMYLADDRFRAYYEAVAPGATQFLCDALALYCA
jgi:DNA-binding transcriptional MerR regulator